MAARKQVTSAKTKRSGKRKTNKPDYLDEFLYLILIIVALFIITCSILPSGIDGLIGFIGLGAQAIINFFFGKTGFLLGVWLLVFAVGMFLPSNKKPSQKFTLIGMVLAQFACQVAVVAYANWQEPSNQVSFKEMGGLIGSFVYLGLYNLVGDVGVVLMVILMFIIALSFLLREPPHLIIMFIGRMLKWFVPSAKNRKRAVKVSKKVAVAAKDVAAQTAEKVVSTTTTAILEDDDAIQAQARNRDLMALVAMEWASKPITTDSVVSEGSMSNEEVVEFIQKQAEEPTRPLKASYHTEGEWWLTPKSLVPDEEIILPGRVADWDTLILKPASNADGDSLSSTDGVSDIGASSPQETDKCFRETEPMSSQTDRLTKDKELDQVNDFDLNENDFDEAKYEDLDQVNALTIQEIEGSFGLPDLADMEDEDNLYSIDQFEPQTTEMTFDEILTDFDDNPSVKYHSPPMDIFSQPRLQNNLQTEALRENADQLERTLGIFGVTATVVNITQGPTITRYELQLAPGIRVNRVANLADDIALGLAALGVRIEAPIPGTSLIGIEVPNKETRIVAIREILSSKEFLESKLPLTVALGVDIAGKPIVADLGRMPHLLIAGTTGSGKSVCMNTLICSLLFRLSPEQVRIIMIDPKVVEMSNYNGIPHLLAPVVTDARKAAGVLKKAVSEMERRYDLFASLSVKNILQYNDYIITHKLDLPRLPYWVIFIDELADLMMVAKADVEQSIIRIAQLARAAGIHLVIGTQRPTTDIITGTIKSNVPSRIAFAVSSGIDSRIILDANGAEKLLGRGDMLFQPVGSQRALRVQGALITEQEVDMVVEYLKMLGAPEYNMAIVNDDDDDDENEGTESKENQYDTRFFEAALLVADTGQASASFLQSRMAIGQPKARRILDQLEEAGVVGPHKGSKPREVIMSREEIINMK